LKEEYKILFEPIKIGKLELKNRFVMAPMGPGGYVMLMELIMSAE
jgi:2-enoate reductase